MPRRRPHSRARWCRRIGTILLALGVLTTGLFLASARWWFGYSTDSWLLDIGDGTLYTQTDFPTYREPLLGWSAGRNNYGRNEAFATWTWWTWGKRKNAWERGHAYTVWPIAPALLLAGAALVWPAYLARRRARTGLCPDCGYPRAGLAPAAPCPECGRTSDHEQPSDPTPAQPA